MATAYKIAIKLTNQHFAKSTEEFAVYLQIQQKNYLFHGTFTSFYILLQRISQFFPKDVNKHPTRLRSA